VHILKRSEIETSLREDPEISTIAERQRFLARYDAALMRQHMTKDPRFRNCPSPGCVWGYVVEDPPQPRRIACPVCKTNFCMICPKDHTEKIACEVFAKTVQDEIEEWKQQHTKPCPRCKANIQKESGCPHIRCRCGYDFCWICLEPYIDGHLRTKHPNAWQYNTDDIDVVNRLTQLIQTLTEDQIIRARELATRNLPPAPALNQFVATLIGNSTARTARMYFSLLPEVTLPQIGRLLEAFTETSIRYLEQTDSRHSLWTWKSPTSQDHGPTSLATMLGTSILYLAHEARVHIIGRPIQTFQQLITEPLPADWFNRLYFMLYPLWWNKTQPETTSRPQQIPVPATEWSLAPTSVIGSVNLARFFPGLQYQPVVAKPIAPPPILHRLVVAPNNQVRVPPSPPLIHPAVPLPPPSTILKPAQFAKNLREPRWHPPPMPWESPPLIDNRERKRPSISNIFSATATTPTATSLISPAVFEKLARIHERSNTFLEHYETELVRVAKTQRMAAQWQYRMNLAKELAEKAYVYASLEGRIQNQYRLLSHQLEESPAKDMTVEQFHQAVAHNPQLALLNGEIRALEAHLNTLDDAENAYLTSAETRMYSSSSRGKRAKKTKEEDDDTDTEKNDIVME